MKILITGSKGQLGSEFRELSGAYPQFDFIWTDLEELDISSETEVDKFVGFHRPDAIINCAAYTAVDKAEADEPAAFSINATAVGNLAKAATKCNSLLLHISTDYVFDGKTFAPYSETAETNPVSVYARSKYAGELEVKKLAKKAIIIRTSWLYSAFGNNFVKTVLKYGIERGRMNIVFDQTGTPTYAPDLARTILDILPKTAVFSEVEIFHYSNEGVGSWYDFALAIVELTGISCELNPIETKDYPLPAVRPFYSVLNKQKIKTAFTIEIPYWRDSLKLCLRRLGYESKSC